MSALGAPMRSVGVVSGYVALTKPRIIELLLVTTLPALVLAADGLPVLTTALATLAGGTLAAGSANVLNCYLDRDIDALMNRTRARPLSRATIPPSHALVFGVFLGVASVALLAEATTLLAAVLAVVAIAFYVGVYTAVLKRRTSSNIVWGGAAGCMPVFIGWAAVTGSLSFTPVVLFGVVFLWTPPHFWALAIHYRDDYAAAGVPMLPVVAPAEAVAAQIVAYSWAMVAVSLLLWPAAGTTLFYPVAAAVLGGLFLREAYRLRARVRAGADPQPMQLFHWSITYLSVLSVCIVADVALAHLG